jgi:hypothetical protein
MQLYFLIPDISLTLTQDDQAEEQKMITASVTGISVCALRAHVLQPGF